MAKPRIHEKRGVGAPSERIMEFGHGEKGTGGLLSLVSYGDDRLRVDLYRMTGPVEVVVSLPRDTASNAATGEVYIAQPNGPSLRASALIKALAALRNLHAEVMQSEECLAVTSPLAREHAASAIAKAEVR